MAGWMMPLPPQWGLPLLGTSFFFPSKLLSPFSARASPPARTFFVPVEPPLKKCFARDFPTIWARTGKCNIPWRLPLVALKNYACYIAVIMAP